MRVLQSHCNQERVTKQLGSLLTKAQSEAVKRIEQTARMRHGPKRLSAETNESIVADYEAGMKSTQIARKYGINEWTVHHRLKRAGVVKRSTSMTELEMGLTVELRSNGMSYDRIAERVGFSATTVRNILKRHRL